MKRIKICLALVSLLSGSAVFADEKEIYSPHADEVFPREVYWGDTHLHSSFSFDSYPFGNESIGPDEAYRFARGEQLLSAGIGQPVRLRRPLDWLVVTDHAEYLGMTKALFEGSDALRANPTGARLYDMVQEGQRIEAVMEIGNSIAQRDELFANAEIKSDIWNRATRIADENNQPGLFTAFIGFEWTSMPGTGDNLHRVVIYRDDADTASAQIPFSAFDSEDPEDLWAWMSAFESSTGGALFAIPHNGNTSNGLMFSDKTLDGEDLSRDYAERRARWEPLYEVTQIKGDGETHPALSSTDEFADFETWDRGNITANTAKEPWMLRHEYARSALTLGLQLQETLGANPFRFGMIGSTDAHTGLSTADDDNFWGKMSTVEPSPERLTERFYGGKLFDVQTRITTASGYTGVWASDNTREALFNAMQRREVYATTGPRMTVRFFGGWGFDASHVVEPDSASVGYRLGVPMGATLPSASGAQVPSFLVEVLKDPDGATLDRVQIVKGWVSDTGEAMERVYNVAWSDQRALQSDGSIAGVGSTVDVNTATWTNDIGAAQLKQVWTDPDFDPAKPAFYYLRVLEIPTPRWTTYDAVRLGLEPPEDVPSVLQQRAYTSPIWYTPDNE